MTGVMVFVHCMVWLVDSWDWSFVELQLGFAFFSTARVGWAPFTEFN